MDDVWESSGGLVRKWNTRTVVLATRRRNNLRRSRHCVGGNGTSGSSVLTSTIFLLLFFNCLRKLAVLPTDRHLTHIPRALSILNSHKSFQGLWPLSKNKNFLRKGYDFSNFSARYTVHTFDLILIHYLRRNQKLSVSILPFCYQIMSSELKNVAKYYLISFLIVYKILVLEVIEDWRNVQKMNYVIPDHF